jgi:hypothetical protein
LPRTSTEVCATEGRLSKGVEADKTLFVKTTLQNFVAAFFSLCYKSTKMLAMSMRPLFNESRQNRREENASELNNVLMKKGVPHDL